MAASGIADWFIEHPEVINSLKKYRLEGESWEFCVKRLQRVFKFPFGSATALARYSQGSTGNERRTVIAKAQQVTEGFKRTQKDLKKLSKSERFFVTSAVNNCFADPGFYRSVQQWQNFTGGKVLVNPILYVNPTRRMDKQGADPDVWWDPAIRDWMLQDEIRPHPKLSIMATKAQATSNNPIPPRIESLTQDRSAIFGHPQVMMRTVATPQDDLPKILYSSGAITKKDYSDTVTGDIAEFHHTLGGVIVEICGPKFHLREVTWDGEQFIDIDTSYTSDGVWDAEPAEALVMGDIHVGLHSNDVMEATFGEGGILDITQAKKLLLHDLFDARSVNSHELRNNLTRAAYYSKGQTNAERELHKTKEWLESFPHTRKIDTFVVASNHDDMLKRWLEGGERNVEAENRALYHHLSAEMLDGWDPIEESFPSVLELGLRRVGYHGNARFLSIDESLRIKGVELGMHGHLGSNGARGSAKGLSRIGTRSIIGHSHSSMIWQGVYQVGHSARNRHGYNKGPSSWLTSHALLLANGRRQMLHLIGRDFRG